MYSGTEARAHEPAVSGEVSQRLYKTVLLYEDFFGSFECRISEEDYSELEMRAGKKMSEFSKWSNGKESSRRKILALNIPKSA